MWLPLFGGGSLGTTLGSKLRLGVAPHETLGFESYDLTSPLPMT